MKYIIAILFLLPTMVSGEEFTTSNASKAIEEMSKRLYKHYEVDDSINGYVLNKIKYGYSIVGPSETKSSNDSKFPQRAKTFKQKVVLKSKNKMYWKFQADHKLIVNPSIKHSMMLTHKEQ
jgi:hypothetical protein